MDKSGLIRLSRNWLARFQKFFLFLNCMIYLECIRSYAWYFSQSDLNLSSVRNVPLKESNSLNCERSKFVFYNIRDPRTDFCQARHIVNTFKYFKKYLSPVSSMIKFWNTTFWFMKVAWLWCCMFHRNQKVVFHNFIIEPGDKYFSKVFKMVNM